MRRKAKTDFTFSDGTVIPAGAVVAAPAYGIHRDSTKYPNPDTFDPLRFSNMRDQDGKDSKLQMVTPDPNFLIFGLGKHMWCVILPTNLGQLTHVRFSAVPDVFSQSLR
jgi:cytochrome P450